MPTRALTNRSWNPWTDLMSLQQEVNRLFEGMGMPSGARTGLLGTDFMPPVDLARDKDRVLVRVDLPGMKREDLDITIQKNHLFIRGTKKHELDDSDKHFHRRERFFGSFERVIELPNPVDADKVTASFTDGVLEVTCPIREEAKPRQIAVEVK